MGIANVQPRVASAPQFVIIADNRPQGLNFLSSTDLDTSTQAPLIHDKSFDTDLQGNNTIADNWPVSPVVSPAVASVDSLQDIEVQVEFDLVAQHRIHDDSIFWDLVVQTNDNWS